MKSPHLAKIKFEPTFFQVLWRFAFSLLLSGEAGGKGVWGEFRPPIPLIKSVRIFFKYTPFLVPEDLKKQ